MTILVVDDEPALLESLRLTLELSGYHVITAPDGVTALDHLNHYPVDLILADITMPRMNGYQLYTRVRQNSHWDTIPFLFLTARSLDSDVRYGKELGVDDYLTKPIEPEDLLATINGKLRRAKQLTRRPQTPPERETSHPLTIGNLEVLPAQHRVLIHGQDIDLSPKEFILLEHLARHAGLVVAPNDLIRASHGIETDDQEAGMLLRPLIRSIRRKLGYDVGEMGCIENVRGVGYRLNPPEHHS